VSAAESVQGPLVSTTANPDRTAATVAHSGLAAHPVVAAILAVTPVATHEESTGHPDPAFAVRVHSEPPNVDLAAKQAAAVLRWLAAIPPTVWQGLNQHDWAVLADEVEAAGTDNTTRTS